VTRNDHIFFFFIRTCGIFGTNIIFLFWHSYVGSIDHVHLSVLFPNCIWTLVQGNPVYGFNSDEKPVSISTIPVIVQCTTKPSDAKNSGLADQSEGRSLMQVSAPGLAPSFKCMWIGHPAVCLTFARKNGEILFVWLQHRR
jgi:hypothetical protein